MKFYLLLSVLIFSIINLLFSCGSTNGPDDLLPGDEENDANYIPAAFLGSWVETEYGDIVTFGSNSRSGILNGFSSQTSIYEISGSNIVSDTEIRDENGYTFLLTNSNLIRYYGILFGTAGEHECLLYRLPDQTAEITGTVSFSSSPSGSVSRAGLSGLAGIDIVISSLQDEKFIKTVSDLSDGEDFTVSDLQAGGEYSLSSVNSETEEILGTINFSADENATDLGAVAVTDQDYLIEIERESAGQYLFGDGAGYDVTFKVYNYGTQESPSSIVNVSSSTVDILSGDSENLTALGAGSSSEFSIEVSLASMSNFTETHRIQVSVTDGNGIVWDDWFSLKFYRDYYTFAHWIEAVGTSSASGDFLVISPEGSTQVITEGTWTLNGIVMEGRIPRWEDPYYIVFSGAAIAPEEHKLVFGLDINPDFFVNETEAVLPAIYEPNDSFETATVLYENQALIFYIGKADLDIIKVIPSVLLSVTGVAADYDSTTGTVGLSWNQAAGAEGYYIFRWPDNNSYRYQDSYFSAAAWWDFPGPLNDDRPMKHLVSPDPVIGTDFTDSGVESGTEYVYAVQAYSSEGGYSTISTVNAVEISIP